MSAPLALSVSQLTALVRGTLSREPLLEDVLVEGEVSNLRSPSSGHLYFTLKDAGASLRCVCWRSDRWRIPFQPENGMTVVAHGRVDVYAVTGTYQLYVDRLEPSGIGALAKAVEQIAARLRVEGLFDAAAKRPLPRLPRRVAVVTSPSGAAIRDVCTVARRRAPQVGLVVVPTVVQGELAAEAMVTALVHAQQLPQVDVVLLVRGGGSFEDLWAFQSEALARAIRASRVPVVTGIGHETDTTIADWAADARAPTPSAAAELVVPDAAALRGEVEAHRERLRATLEAGLGRRRRELGYHLARLFRASPQHRVAAERRAIDLRRSQLRAALVGFVGQARRRLDDRRGRLALVSPSHRLERERDGLGHRLERLERAAERVVELRRARLSTAAARLEALSPRRVLQRGYSVTLDADTGRLVTSVAGLARGRRLRTLVTDGSAVSIVDVVDPATRDRGLDFLTRTDVR